MNTERHRTTISVSPEVHEIFKRMAEVSGMSVSRCIGEWLADTSEGAQLIASKMEEARKAPSVVMRELRSSLGDMSHLNRVLNSKKEEALQVATEGLRSALRRSPPVVPAPSSNTGLKSPKKGKGGAK